MPLERSLQETQPHTLPERQDQTEDVQVEQEKEMMLARAEKLVKGVERLRGDILNHAVRFQREKKLLKERMKDKSRAFLYEGQRGLLMESEGTAVAMMEEATELGHRAYRLEDALRAGMEVDENEFTLIQAQQEKLAESALWLKGIAKQMDWSKIHPDGEGTIYLQKNGRLPPTPAEMDERALLENAVTLHAGLRESPLALETTAPVLHERVEPMQKMSSDPFAADMARRRMLATEDTEMEVMEDPFLSSEEQKLREYKPKIRDIREEVTVKKVAIESPEVELEISEDSNDLVSYESSERLSPQERLMVLRDVLASDEAFLQKYEGMRAEEAGLRGEIERVTGEMKSAPYEGRSEEVMERHVALEERLIALHQRTQLLQGLAKEARRRRPVITRLMAKIESNQPLIGQDAEDLESLKGVLLEKGETYLFQDDVEKEKKAGLYERMAWEVGEMPERVNPEDSDFEYKEIPQLRVPEVLVMERIQIEKARIERRLAFLRQRSQELTARMALADEKTREGLEELSQDIEGALPINKTMLKELKTVETALAQEEPIGLKEIEVLRRVEEAVLRSQMEKEVQGQDSGLLRKAA